MNIPNDDVAAFREKLMKQMSNQPADAPVDRTKPPTILSPTNLKRGTVLLANPIKFVTRNPLAQPVADLKRFGLAGPIAASDRDAASADLIAQMLPVLLILEHSPQTGTSAVFFERRTGALMGDVSMDEFGCVAISPLWLGGVEQQDSIKVSCSMPRSAHFPCLLNVCLCFKKFLHFAGHSHVRRGSEQCISIEQRALDGRMEGSEAPGCRLELGGGAFQIFHRVNTLEAWAA